MFFSDTSTAKLINSLQKLAEIYNRLSKQDQLKIHQILCFEYFFIIFTFQHITHTVTGVHKGRFPIKFRIHCSSHNALLLEITFCTVTIPDTIAAH